MRVQNSILAAMERRLIDAVCARMPASVRPNDLTLVGVLGAFLVLACDGGSTWTKPLLLLAIGGYLLNWFGDSFDGSLARFRGTARPKFGFFLDHSVDAFSNSMMVFGLGLTSCVRLDVALCALVAYLLMTLLALLADKSLGVFRISYCRMGPTELRLLLIGFHVAMYLTGPLSIVIAGRAVGAYDAVFGLAAASMVTLFVVEVAAGLRKLNVIDPEIHPRNVGFAERLPIRSS